MDSLIRKTVLDNGLTVVSQQIPAVRSVSVGVWIKAGSRYENKENNGIAHFLEHMVFKGSEKRSAFQIARSMEQLGGTLNAFTSKELTVYYTHTLDSHLRRSISVLSELVCRPLLREKDIRKEKLVVLEELSAVKDTPDEYVFDLFQEKLFPEQSIGYPILGTADTVRSFDRAKLERFWSETYCPDNIVLSAAGNLEHGKLVRLVEKYFTFSTFCSKVRLQRPKSATHVRLQFKESVSQSHICAGIESVSYLSMDRYQMIALNSYLGGGMSSRLFQSIREKYGLAYTVYSFIDFYRDTGIFSFYMGTERSKQAQAIDLFFNEIEKLRQRPIGKNTVRMIREQLKGNFLLGLESTYRRMSRLAKNEIYYQRQIAVDELVNQLIEKITPESLLEMARKILIIDHFNIIILDPNA